VSANEAVARAGISARNGESPPHDLEAEESLLGAMLLDGRATAAAIEICGAEDFHRPAHGHIFGAIVALFERGEPIDAVTVRDELVRSGLIDSVGDPAVLVSLQANTPSISHGPHYARIVSRLAKDRQLIILGRKIAEAAYRGDADAAKAAARQVLDDVLTGRSGSERFVDGATFVTEDATVDPIWGNGDDILMAKGEALLVCGPTGLGKTTLAQQLMLHRMGLRAGPLLGLSVAADPDIVFLYMAMDRPKQVARSLSRMVGPEHLDELRRRLVVWRGPPERDLAQHPGELLAMARRAHAGGVVIDSLKDAAVGLSDDEVGAGWNRAAQTLLAEGDDLVVLHHQRKAQPGNRPNSIDDVYGSTWITAGAGSVVLLWGKPGDQIVELLHLKQPVAPVGPFKIEHDRASGSSAVHEAFDLLETLSASPSGLTSTDAARLWFEVEHPDDNQRRRAKRALDDLVAKEPPLAHRTPGRKGGPGGTEAVRYYATTDREEP
jgi:replicative DNA helicase